MPRFANMKGSMNPFDNNKPVLSSSDRLKNKRDATIYQAEKQRFQNKRCGNKNVKYYNNGTIRNMKSYDLQNSLTRGNVLCEDCDDKGLLCGGVASKSALGSIQMGNNVVSEYWGGGELVWADGKFTQSITFPVIQADISGSWGGTTDKADLSGQKLPGSDPSANMFWGYINNLIKIPRNLNGDGIVIDPCNNLFPDGLCDAFKHQKSHIPYMNHSQLKTYLVARMIVPIKDTGVVFYTPSTCDDPSYNNFPGAFCSVSGPGIPIVVNGQVDSLCCVYEGFVETEIVYPPYPNIPVGNYGVFDVYINLFTILNYPFLSTLVGTQTSGSIGLWDWGAPIPLGGTDLEIVFSKGTEIFAGSSNYIESFRIFQGTQKLNQTKHNTTKQSYMSCLENKTKKIKFT
jgi:hypothetical protein